MVGFQRFRVQSPVGADIPLRIYLTNKFLRIYIHVLFSISIFVIIFVFGVLFQSSSCFFLFLPPVLHSLITSFFPCRLVNLPTRRRWLMVMRLVLIIRSIEINRLFSRPVHLANRRQARWSSHFCQSSRGDVWELCWVRLKACEILMVEPT